MKKTISYVKIVFILLSISFAACKKEETVEAKQEPFTGIMETDSRCIVLGGDTTDFRPQPLNGGILSIPQNYSLIRACPNPVIGDTVAIDFQIPVADSVWLQVFMTTNAPPVATILKERLPAGVFRFMWGFNAANGIYRVRMSTASGFSSYGDVEFR